MRRSHTFRRALGLAVAVGLAWAFSGCATMQATGAGKSSGPAASKVQKTTLSDEELRTRFDGTWIMELGAQQRIETTFSPEGRFDRSITLATVEGIQHFRDLGTWKIENGNLTLVALTSTDSGFSDIGKEDSFMVVTIDDAEAVLLSMPRNQLTIRKKPADNPLLNELLVKGRYPEHFSAVLKERLLGFEKQSDEGSNAEPMSHEMRAAVRNFLTMAFAPERLMETFVQEMEKRLTPDEIRAAIAWEDSPLGRKTTQLRLDAYGEAEQRKEDAYIAGFRQTPPPAERLRLAREVDRACREAEGSVDLKQKVQLANEVGVMVFQRPDQRISLDKLREQMEKDRPTLIAMEEPLVVGGILYRYRSLTDREFEDWARFWLSEFGIRYSEAYGDSFNRTLLDAVVRYWQAMAMMGTSGRKTPSGT